MKYNNKEVEYLQSILKIRDWSVSTVNGKKDKQKQMPCREQSDYWKPLIELKTGQILNWEKGVTASTRYKVSDSGVYRLLDKDKNVVAEREGYVPRLLAPEDKSFAGDYVMMNIDENGFIKNWKPVLNQFDFNFINETMSFRKFLKLNENYDESYNELGNVENDGQFGDRLTFKVDGWEIVVVTYSPINYPEEKQLQNFLKDFNWKELSENDLLHYDSAKANNVESEIDELEIQNINNKSKTINVAEVTI